MGRSLAVSFSWYNITKKQFAVTTMLLTNSHGMQLLMVATLGMWAAIATDVCLFVLCTAMSFDASYGELFAFAPKCFRQNQAFLLAWYQQWWRSW